MIDHEAEHTFLLSKAGQKVNFPLSPATAHRWALKGIRGVQLESILIGGRRCTSREAIGRFLARLREPQAAAKSGQSEQRAGEIARASKRAGDTSRSR